MISAVSVAVSVKNAFVENKDSEAALFIKGFVNLKLLMVFVIPLYLC